VSLAQRLSELGLTLPDVVPPVAAYVPAVRQGDLVYTAGQLPIIDGQLPAAGKVGAGPGLVDPDTAHDLARQAALNGLAAAASLVGDVEKLRRVVKVVGFVASDPAFTAQPQVINGASQVLQEIFGDAGVHARSAVGVAVLPMDSPVEVELILEVD